MSSDSTSSGPKPVSLPRPVGGRRLDWCRTAAGAAVLLLAVCGVYWPALRGPFLWDDLLVVNQNPLVTGKLGFGSIWFHTDFPLTNVAFWLEWLAWGDHAVGYHVVNGLLHALSAMLLWRVLARLRIPAPWLAAMIFAVHPVCVGSVAWISELKNTLSLPFFLLSLLWYLRSEPDLRVSGFKFRVSALYSLSLLAFLLALLSKTSTVMLPVVLLGLAWWQRGRIAWREVLRVLPFFALALAFGVMTIGFQSQGAISGATVQSENLWGRLAGAGMALWFYLGKALLPLHLNMIYPKWKIDAGAAASYLPLLLWCGLLVACWLWGRTWGRHVLFGLGCFTALLFPVLGFFDMFFLTMSRVSDHFEYLPLVALVALGAGGLGWWLGGDRNHGWTRMDTDSAGPSADEGPAVSTNAVQASSHLCSSVSICGCNVLWCIGGGLVLALAVLANLRAGVFVSEETLWRDTLARNPGAWCAHANLGWILASHQKYDQARTHLEASLALKPDNAAALSNLGRVLSLQGKPAEAEPRFQAALALKPKDADIRKAYATALAEQGRTAEAVAQLQEAIRLGPGTDLRLQLAALLRETGKLREAMAEYRAVLAVKPDEPEALNNLAWLLATCADPTLRDGVAAVSLAEHACRLSGFKDARPLGTLAAAFAEAGRFTDAVLTAQKAIDLADSSGDSQLASVGKQLLRLYRAGKPYHEPATTP
jgi:protein O-mannosyl-transferase